MVKKFTVGQTYRAYTHNGQKKNVRIVQRDGDTIHCRIDGNIKKFIVNRYGLKRGQHYEPIAERILLDRIYLTYLVSLNKVD